MNSPTIGQLDIRCPTIGKLDIHCQTIGQSDIHSYTCLIPGQCITLSSYQTTAHTLSTSNGLLFMDFTSLGQLEEKCPIMCNVKPLNNWRYTAQTSDTWTNKPLPKSILIVSILADFPVFSQLYSSERRHFVREHCLRRLPLSGPLIVPIRGRDDIPLLSGQSGGTFSLSLCYERVVLPQLQSKPDDIYIFFFFFSVKEMVVVFLL